MTDMTEEEEAIMPTDANGVPVKGVAVVPTEEGVEVVVDGPDMNDDGQADWTFRLTIKDPRVKMALKVLAVAVAIGLAVKFLMGW